MSKFNSSISVLGIAEVKVQQAILKLLENSLYQKELIGKTSDNLNEQLRRIRQQLSQADLNSNSVISNPAENIGWSHINVDLDNATFLMSGLVSESSATYNLKVTFINKTTTEISCLVNGTTVSLAGGNGQTATHQTTVSGSGSFTIDNIASSVDVFVRIWR